MPVTVNADFWPIASVHIPLTITDRATGDPVDDATATAAWYEIDGDSPVVGPVNVGHTSGGDYEATADLSGLTPGRRYELRIVVSNPHKYEERHRRRAAYPGTERNC